MTMHEPGLGRSVASSPAHESVAMAGPRADSDWKEATVVVRLPVHSTAMTTISEVELTLPQLAVILEGFNNG